MDEVGGRVSSLENFREGATNKGVRVNFFAGEEGLASKRGGRRMKKFELDWQEASSNGFKRGDGNGRRSDKLLS